PLDHLAGTAIQLVDDGAGPDPQRVVADPQSTGADPLAGRRPRLRVLVLVDVAEHDVEVAVRLAERGERVPGVEASLCRQAGAAKIVMCLYDIRLVVLREVDLALWTHGPAEPVRRIPEPGAQ